MTRVWHTILLFLVLVAPLSAAAQIPLFDPTWQLVPKVEELDPACEPGAPLGFGGVLVLAQNAMNAAISFGVIIFVLIIAYAGILWILTPTNPEAHSQARNILTNAVFGFLILLSAWLIVDFVMKLVYNSNSAFGPWNEIISGGDICVQSMEVKPLFSGEIPKLAEGANDFTFVPSSGPGACNPNVLKQSAQSAGLTLSDADANTFACIARPESSCGIKLKNYMWGRGSSAYGAFQVLLSQNARHYENATCRAAAGLAPNQPLNCAAGFTGGNPIPGSPIVQRCINAASNLTCSLAAAISLKRETGNFRPWIADRNSSKQRACIGA